MSNENTEQPILCCPHCKDFIIIEKINCGIFRHGVFKNGKQIDPHAPETSCNMYINKNLIYGCGKPFKIIEKDGKYDIEICDYI